MIAELFLKLLKVLEFVTQILCVFLSYHNTVTRWQTDKCITSFLTKTCMISPYSVESVHQIWCTLQICIYVCCLRLFYSFNWITNACWRRIVWPVVVIGICIAVVENPWSSNFKHCGSLLIWLFMELVKQLLLSKPCLSHMCCSYFYDNFGKRGPSFIFFHCYVQKGSAEK